MSERSLLITADDFGIGPATSEGILELAEAGLITNTVLLVNSPYAEHAVNIWRASGSRLEVGWHPCLTLDGPVASPERVPSLLRQDGRFHSLGAFMFRLIRGRICPSEIRIELRAQWRRFVELVGSQPTVVNSHHHVQVFPYVGGILREILTQNSHLPYVRRVQEPWISLLRVPGARGKRCFLTQLGKREAKRQAKAGLPGADWLAGITDPQFLDDADFFVRWLRMIPGQSVELTCHPGHLDETLLTRDCAGRDAQWLRRDRERRLLLDPRFRATCRDAGFAILSPKQFLERCAHGCAHAA